MGPQQDWEFPEPPMQSRSILAPVCRYLAAVSLLALTVSAAPVVRAQSLLGSRDSLLRQNEEARDHDFSYLRTASDVRDFARRGLLVRLKGNSDYRLATDSVSFPYARPEVKLFIERLADQYHGACGERLTVTSLTRPITRQPPNASHLSVHPTGMAADLRRSSRASCRQWLEGTLLELEGKGLIEATREQWPPHYHVTLFPNPYLRYLEANDVPRVQVAKVKASKSSTGRTTVASHRSTSKRYRVGRGDTLWRIAQRHGVSVSRLKAANGLRSASRLKAGQVLAIPAR
jgi:LysM repeat protein